jgi:gliding motility-associated-like protein
MKYKILFLKTFRLQILMSVVALVFPQVVTPQQLSASKSIHALPANESKVGKTLWVAKNPFNKRLFLENVGQYNGKNNIPKSVIKYGVCDGQTWVYFSSNGLSYRHDEHPQISEEDMEKVEHAKDQTKRQQAVQAMLKVETTIVNMQWLGSNPNVEIETEGEAPDHFSYPPDAIEGYKGLETFIAKGFTKIIYKNLYKGIDIEYTMMPEEKGGLKYAFILHPGADPSVIKMKYADGKKLKLDKEGNVVINSKMGEIIDHSPFTFYKDGASISSQFVLNDNIVSFQISNYDHSKTIVIDPWTTTPTFIGSGNNAYDVDFDDAGNVYAYGGANPYSVVKFNNLGTQGWSFNANFSGTNAYGDFAVDQKSGSIYICEAVNLAGGASVKKIRATSSTAAAQVGSNFVGDSRFNEMWRIQYNPCIGKTVIGGASINTPSYFQAAMLDTSLSALTPVNMFNATEPYHDIGLLAVDDYGSTYMLTAKSQFCGCTNLDNSMAKAPVPALTPTTWQVSSGLTIAEYSTATYVSESTSAYNGMAVSPNYLYNYDGKTLQQRNMGSGTVVKSVIVGGAANVNLKYGGITVDRCDNVYVGFNSTIHRFDVNLVDQGSIATTSGNVFDLKIGKNDILYASGAGFVQALGATPCANNVMTLAMSSAGSCSGTGSATVAVSGGTPAYTYAWSTTPVQTTTTATGLSAGTYTVTVTDASCAKAVATNTVVVSSGSGPATTVTPTATICAGGSVTLIASGAGSYSWSPSNSVDNSVVASVVATPTVTTTYTVTGTSTGCSSTAISTVTVNSLPIVDVNDVDVCTGQSAILTASGASTYTWTPATSLSATTGTSVTSTTSIAINYTVIGTLNGCDASAVSAVTISTMPSSNAGADITICSGTTGNIGAPATSGYIYIWSPTTGLSNSTAADPTITLTNISASPVTSSYTVTTSPAGCSSTDVVNVTVNPQIDPTFSYPSSTICKAGGTNPFPTMTTTGGGFSIQPNGLPINTSTGELIKSSGAINTYTVTYTFAGTCPSSSTFNISLVNVPDATFSYGGPYCQNSSPNPLAIFPAGSSAGVFSSSPAGLVFLNNPTGEVNLTTSSPNTYTVTNTIAGGGSSGCPSVNATYSITINAIPVTIVNNQTTCSGASATLTAGGATTYLWSDNSSSTTLTAGPLTTTSYTVTGTASGCSSSAVGTITTNPIPTVTVNSATVCAGVSATLTASGASSYLWSTNAAINTISDNPAATQTYTVTGTLAGCTSTATGTIVVTPTPTVTVNSPTVCQAQTATLTASGATNYLWSGGSNINPLVISPGVAASYSVTGTTAGCTATALATVTVIQTPTITVNAPTVCKGTSATLIANGGSAYTWSNGTTGSQITVTPLVPTSYTVTDNTAGCSGSAVGTISVNLPPNVTVNSAVLCLGETRTLTAGGATTYLWPDGSTSKNLTITPLVAGTTTYTVIGDPASGCSGSALATITTNPLPKLSIIPDTICEGAIATLTAVGGVSYLWSNGVAAPSISVSPNKTTNYSVQGFNAAGCPAVVTSTVEVYKKPIANFISSPTNAGVLSPIITFTDKSSSGVNSWTWDFGDGVMMSPDTQNPIHTYPAIEETYTVTLSVLNPGLCPDTVQNIIVIGPEFSFYIPNAFTPTGDKINDGFGAKGAGILKFQLLIFDRWGNQIFSANDINKYWDGKASGGDEIAQQDVYVWKVRLTDILKKEHNYIGTVTIVKGD